jgi:L-galactonate dehydratase
VSRESEGRRIGGLANDDFRYYVTPKEPGYSVEMKPESMDKFSFPGGEGGWWKSEEAKVILESEKI